MTIQEYKKIARLLKEVYKEVETEAKSAGLSILSDEYDEAIQNARKLTLEKLGYTVEEYLAIKGKQADELAQTKNKVKNIEEELENEKSREIPTTEDIEEIAERISEQVAEKVAKKYIKPPQVKIVNKIVERIKEPKIIKETVKVTERVEYDEKPLQEKLSKLSKKVDEIKIPEPVNVIALKEELGSEFQQNLEKNINMLGMPNFRKLAMGLQQQIDELKGPSDGSVDAAGNDTEIQVNVGGVLGAYSDFTFDGDIFNLGDSTYDVQAGEFYLDNVELISNSTGTFTSVIETTPTLLKLDQTTPQSITGGAPDFTGGITMTSDTGISFTSVTDPTFNGYFGSYTQGCGLCLNLSLLNATLVGGTSAGEFTDGINTVILASNTYAIDSFGSVNFSDGTHGFSFGNGAYAGTFMDGNSHQVVIADGTNAINATGNILGSGSLVIDTDTLVVNATGYEDKVGIGTTSPEYNLHIKNGGLTYGTEFVVEDTGATKRPAFYLTNNTGQRAGFFNYGTGYGTYASDLRIHMDNTSGDTHFTGMRGVGIKTGDIDLSGDFQVGASNFVITSTGKVGIGTTAPTSKVDILTDVNTVGLNITGTSGQVSDYVNVKDDNGTTIFSLDRLGNITMQNPTQSSLTLALKNTIGEVGMDESKVEVWGQNKALFVGKSNGGTQYFNMGYNSNVGGVALIGYGGGSAIRMDPSNRTTIANGTSDFLGRATVLSGNASYIGLVVKGYTSQTADLQQWRDINNNVLSVITANGSLGIGTTTPGYKLTVVGDASITGTTTSGFFSTGGTLQFSSGKIIAGDITGNARGTNAVDIQSARGEATQVASGEFSSAFGYFNTASGDSSSASGYNNTAEGCYSSAFGYFNTASGYKSSAFGSLNCASGSCSSALGYVNAASGLSSSAFGTCNTASGNYSSAFGYKNTASAEKSSAFGNNLTNDTCCSAMLGSGDGWIKVFCDNCITTSSGAHLTTGGAWTDSSSRKLKENFTDLDKKEILEKISQLNIQEWNYIAEDDTTKHIGPVAEDWFSMFRLGDDKSIAALDTSGVALLGVQAIWEHITDFGKYVQMTAEGIIASFKEIRTEKYGEINLHGTARVLREVWIPSTGFNPAGAASQAVLDDIGISVAYKFDDGQQDCVMGNIKIPPDMDRTVAPTISIDWSTPTTATDETCVWQLEYLYTAAGEDTSAAAQETLEVSGNAVATAHGLIVSTFSGVDAPSADDVCIHIRITRLGDDGDDDLTDDAFLHGLCMQYTSNKLGQSL